MTQWIYVTAWARRTIRWQTAVAVVIALVLAVSGYSRWIGGWLLGAAFNLLYMAYLMLILAARRHDAPTTMTRRLAAVAAGRLWIAIVFLIVVLKTGVAHFGATACGLLSFKLALILEASLQRR